MSTFPLSNFDAGNGGIAFEIADNSSGSTAVYLWQKGMTYATFIVNIGIPDFNSVTFTELNPTTGANVASYVYSLAFPMLKYSVSSFTIDICQTYLTLLQSMTEGSSVRIVFSFDISAVALVSQVQGIDSGGWLSTLIGIGASSLPPCFQYINPFSSSSIEPKKKSTSNVWWIVLIVVIIVAAIATLVTVWVFVYDGNKKIK